MGKGMRWDRVGRESVMRSRGSEELVGRSDRSQIRIVNRLDPLPPAPRKPKRAPNQSHALHGAHVEADEALCLRETLKAILVVFGGRHEWLPKRSVHPSSKVRKAGDHGRLVIFDWWKPSLTKLCNDPT